MSEKIVRRVSIYVDGDRVIDNIKGIKAEYKRLLNEQAKAPVNSKEYIESSMKIRKLDKILAEHRSNIKQSGGAWQKLRQSVEEATGIGISKGIAWGAALGAIAAGLWQGLKGAMALEKALSQLKSLTGASTADITYYREEALRMGKDMGMSAESIVKSFQLVGGAKPELLKSKDALAQVTKEALILSKASGLEVPDAAKRLTDAMNQYSIAGKDAARVSNALAAGAKEGAVEIPEQTEAMLKFGAVAQGANISVEESIGLIQTLGEKGIKGAEAGTQLRNVLLRLEAGSRDTRPSVVGLSAAIDNLAKKQLSTTELTKMFGMESVVAAQNLIKSSDKIKYYTEAVTGTSEAYRQAEINGDNLASTWEKTVNKIQIATTSLIVKSGITTFFNDMLKSVGKAFDELGDASKGATEGFKGQLDSVVNLQRNIVPLGERYDFLKAKTSKTAAEQAEMKRIIGQVADTIPGAVTQFDKYGNAIAISTEKINQFVGAEVMRLKVLNKSAIKETLGDIDQLNKRIAVSQSKLDQVTKTGTFAKGYTAAVPGQPSTPIMATKEDVLAERATLKQMQDERTGHIAELRRLNGDYLKDELKSREEADKAAKKEADKKRMEDEQSRKAAADSAAREEVKANGDKLKKKKEAILKQQQELKAEMDSFSKDLKAKQRSAEEEEFREVEKKYAKLAEKAHGNKDLLVRLEELKQRELASVRSKYRNSEVADALTKVQSDQVQQGEDYMAGVLERKDAEARISEAIMSDKELERKRIKEHYAELIVLARKYGLDVTALVQKMKDEFQSVDRGDLFGMKEKDWDSLTKRFNGIMTMAGELTAMWQSYDQLRVQQENQALANQEQRNNKEKLSLKKKLDQGLISRKTYDKKVALMDSAMEERKRQMAVKQAKRQKAIQSVLTVINTASAVMGFLSDKQLDPWMRIALSAMAGITGAIQLATINSAEIPGYIDGGRVKGKQLAWLSEDNREEGVINNRTLTDRSTGPIANWLLDRQEGKSTPMPALPTASPAGGAAVSAVERSREVVVVVRRDGEKSPAGSTSGDAAISILQEVKALTGYLSDPENRRAIITHEELNKRSKEKALISQLSTLKK